MTNITQIKITANFLPKIESKSKCEFKCACYSNMADKANNTQKSSKAYWSL